MECIIFHDKKEIDYIKKIKNLKQINIYAWTPEAIDELNKLGLKYILPGDLYKQFDLRQRMYFLNKYKKIINFFDYKFQKEQKLKYFFPFQNFSLGVRNIFAFYFFEVDIIFLLLKKYKILYYFDYKSKNNITSLILKKLSNHNKSIKRIKSLWDINSGLLMPKDYNTTFPSNYNNFFYKKFRKQLSRIKNLQKFNIDIILKKKINTNAKNILILDTDYKDIEKKIIYFKKKNYNIFFWHNFTNNNKKKIIDNFFFDKLKNNQQINKLLKIKNISFGKDIIKYFQIILCDKINLLYTNLCFFKKLNQKYNFKFILSSFDDPLSQTISGYLERQKIKTKVLIFQHGGTLGLSYLQPFQNEYTKTGGSNTCYLVYTQAIEKHQRKITKQFNTKTNYLTSTNSYYKNIFLKNRKKKTNINGKYDICVIVGQFHKICENNFGIYRESNMYSVILKIIEILYNLDHINLTIKCGYGFENRKLNIFQKFPNVKIIKTKKYLVNYADRFDAFIMPSISSPFKELSCTNRTLIAYNDVRVDSFKKTATRFMKKRAFLCSDLNEFFNLIKSLRNYDLCKQLLHDKKRLNRQYAEKYCINNGPDKFLNKINLI